jgi:hypothetical protein
MNDRKTSSLAIDARSVRAEPDAAGMAAHTPKKAAANKLEH